MLSGLMCPTSMMLVHVVRGPIQRIGSNDRLIVVMAGRVSGNDVALVNVGVRRCLGSILIDLTLKNQGSDPNGLDYGENKRSNEPCDNCRKYRLTNHKTQ